jgi:hypothetical protein
MTTDPHPGDHASPYQMNRLADFYRDAAHRSSGSIQMGDPLSAGPMRLLAIHSIELNLSAYLLLQGSTWPAIRKMGHDLAARVDLRRGEDWCSAKELRLTSARLGGTASISSPGTGPTASPLLRS